MTAACPLPVLYYEAHVTVEPCFDERLDELARVATAHGFRVADLLMRKRQADTGERSAHDSFMTARGHDFALLYRRTCALEGALRAAGFRVWRSKVESTLFDQRYDRAEPHGPRVAELGDLDTPSREPEFTTRAKRALHELGETLDEARAAGCPIRLMVDTADDGCDQVWPDRHLHVYPPRRERTS